MRIKLSYFYYCNVPMIRAIQINYYKILLLIRRTLRLFKRMWLHLKSLLLLYGIMSIFIIMLVFLLLQLKQYKSFGEGLWDFRVMITSTFFSSYVITYIDFERRRHKILVEQAWVYSDVLYYAEAIESYLLDKFSINIDAKNCFHIFEYSENVLSSIKKNEGFKISIPYNNQDENIMGYVHSLIKLIDDNRVNFNNNFEPNIHDFVIDNLYHSLKHLSQSNIEKKSITLDITDLRSITSYFRIVIANLRRPWRTIYDVNINSKIIDLIRKHHLGNIEKMGIDFWPTNYKAPFSDMRHHRYF